MNLVNTIDPVVPALALVLMIARRLRPGPARLVDVASAGRHAAPRDRTGQRPRSLPGQERGRWRIRKRVPLCDAAARWCDAISRELRAGSSLRHAVVAADREPVIERVLGPAILQIGRGAGLHESLADINATAQSDLRLVLTLLMALSRSGGPAAPAIDRAAAVLRERSASAAERRSQSAQARHSARVMTLLPLVMLAVLVTTSGSVRSVLTTPLGVAVVSTGVVCNLVGWWWMNRIVGGSMS